MFSIFKIININNFNTICIYIFFFLLKLFNYLIEFTEVRNKHTELKNIFLSKFNTFREIQHDQKNSREF